MSWIGYQKGVQKFMWSSIFDVILVVKKWQKKFLKKSNFSWTGALFSEIFLMEIHFYRFFLEFFGGPIIFDAVFNVKKGDFKINFS